MTYQVYEENSTRFIIDLSNLDQFIKSKLGTEPQAQFEDQLQQWLEHNCYYIIPTVLMADFQLKLNHNLSIAQRLNDRQYVNYISKKLSIEIKTQEIWEYTPRKFTIKLKNLSGFMIPDHLAQLLSAPLGKLYKYKSEIIRLVHQYIYQHELQNRYDRKVITPDELLHSLLLPLNSGEREYTYDNLLKYVPIKMS